MLPGCLASRLLSTFCALLLSCGCGDGETGLPSRAAGKGGTAGAATPPNRTAEGGATQVAAAGAMFGGRDAGIGGSAAAGSNGGGAIGGIISASGSATGGSATGGNATGGNATGGNATGGNATGGSSDASDGWRPCVAVSVAASPEGPRPVGVNVRVTAAASCPAAAVAEYRFMVGQLALPEVELRGWGPASASWDTTTLVVGNYVVRAEVRQLGAGGDVEAIGALDYSLSLVCGRGYRLSSDAICVDIDECATNNGGCDVLSTCTNSPGSYSCGPCPVGYSGTGSLDCVDTDECATNNGGCVAHSKCINTLGSHTCGTCNDGYSGSQSAGCVDTDECATNNGGCVNSKCENTLGGHYCGVCELGFVGSGATDCQDINECDVNSGGCVNSKCENTPGSYYCGVCDPGYAGSGATICVDIDECAVANGGCVANSECMNTQGGHTCGACKAGYEGCQATGCVDIDECATTLSVCDPLTICTNAPAGSYTCSACPSGYRGTGKTGCSDIDECAEGSDDCDSSAECFDRPGSYICVCPDDYIGTGLKHCKSIVSCLDPLASCQHGGTCTETRNGRYVCECTSGFTGDHCEGRLVAAVGDVAECNSWGADSSAGRLGTASLLDSIPGPILLLGDGNNCSPATEANYLSCFDAAWGRHKPRLRPIPGNHDYDSDSGATPYVNYFGAETATPEGAKYYSYDIDNWHFIALDTGICRSAPSNCMANSGQEVWLRADLAKSTANCTIAYSHFPRYSSGLRSSEGANVAPLWTALVEHGVELLLSGHDHDYERFALMDVAGALQPPGQGLVQLVVGTGGATLRAFNAPAANSEVRIGYTYGVLKLTLRDNDYDWEFISIAGVTLDSGTAPCHGIPAVEAPL